MRREGECSIFGFVNVLDVESDRFVGWGFFQNRLKYIIYDYYFYMIFFKENKLFQCEFYNQNLLLRSDIGKVMKI